MTPFKQRTLEHPHIRNYSPSTVRCYLRSVAGNGVIVREMCEKAPKAFFVIAFQ